MLTVADLKKILATHDDSEEVKYFDSEAGDDMEMFWDYISFEKQINNDTK